jgi:proteasome lid subunit RPN8/RPN11
MLNFQNDFETPFQKPHKEVSKSLRSVKKLKEDKTLHELQPYEEPASWVQQLNRCVCSCNELTMACTVQPFNLDVYPHVTFLCELHGRLSNHEIIGLLAGSWDYSKKVLCVKWIVPLDAVPMIDGAQQCDAEASALAKASEIISGMNLSVVGWYHSHPKFVPHPSGMDLLGHVRLVKFISGSSYEVPFVGLIVGIKSNEHLWFHAKDGEARRLKAHVLNISDTSTALNENISASLVIELLYRYDDGNNMSITLPNTNILLLPDTFHYLVPCIVHLCVYYMSCDERVNFATDQALLLTALIKKLASWLEYLLPVSDSMKYASSVSELLVFLWGQNIRDHTTTVTLKKDVEKRKK